jgi:hypothetical protein
MFCNFVQPCWFGSSDEARVWLDYAMMLLTNPKRTQLDATGCFS